MMPHLCYTIVVRRRAWGIFAALFRNSTGRPKAPMASVRGTERAEPAVTLPLPSSSWQGFRGEASWQGGIRRAVGQHEIKARHRAAGCEEARLASARAGQAASPRARALDIRLWRRVPPYVLRKPRVHRTPRPTCVAPIAMCAWRSWGPLRGRAAISAPGCDSCQRC